MSNGVFSLHLDIVPIWDLVLTMRVIARSALVNFWEKYPESKVPLTNWYLETTNSSWKTPAHIKHAYSSASVLKNGRVVFNIAGNKFRLVVAISYPIQLVYIKFVGTHAQYDRIDAQTVDYRG